ncbi:hypothetical protein C8R43DRAFT_522183 [Mycena crocata]|nr:hypothetical protein C8R43DRAFT_522183 [Mycena crocata]
MKPISWSHLGVGRTFDPQHKFVSSPIVSPAVLAGIRLLLALYALCTICTVLGFSVHYHNAKSFLSYFTELSYIGLVAYYCAAAVQSLFYARYGRYWLQRWPRPLQALHVLLQSTVTTFPFIVTIVFWVLLASPRTFSTTYGGWSNISIHALNSVFALFEILLTNAPPAPWLALPVHILLLAGYLGVAYITHITQGFYTYDFLDPHKEGALLAAYIVGIAVGEIVVFLLARGVTVLRQRLVVRRGLLREGHDSALMGGGGGEAIDEWEEVARPGAPDAEKGHGGVTQEKKTEGNANQSTSVVDSGLGENEGGTTTV